MPLRNGVCVCTCCCRRRKGHCLAEVVAALACVRCAAWGLEDADLWLAAVGCLCVLTGVRLPCGAFCASNRNTIYILQAYADSSLSLCTHAMKHTGRTAPHLLYSRTHSENTLHHKARHYYKRCIQQSCTRHVLQDMEGSCTAQTLQPPTPHMTHPCTPRRV